VISLKKYLDMEIGAVNNKENPAANDPDSLALLSATLECYRSMLLAMGNSAGHASPAIGKPKRNCNNGRGTLHRILQSQS
jgi:hypothetical protein